MAASMWRMNGVWSRVAGVLVLCALLLGNEVMCQDDAATDATDAPTAGPPADAADGSAVTDAAGSAAPPDATAAQVVANHTVAAGEESTTPAAPGDGSLPLTIGNAEINPDNQGGGASGTTAAPIVREEVAATAEVPDDSHNVKLVVPDVTCVGQNDSLGSTVVIIKVDTVDCEESKRIIQETPAGWCETQNCHLKLRQNGKTLITSSNDVKFGTLAEVLNSKHLKDKLTKAPPPPSSSSSSGSSVFVGILVPGLLAAIAITVGYFKCQRRSDTKGVKLAEEAQPLDQENQGSTLVSVAPLNPPPETQEKPSVNGESPEAAKIQPPPPTNGHSATKTADTEM